MRRAMAVLLLLLSTTAFAKPPRLVLVISVDGMGTDLFNRMKPKLKLGFAQLVNGGAWFPNAHYGYAKTCTAAGHTTLATGANPWRHGITGNRGFNKLTGRLDPIFVDAAHPALEAPPAIEDVSPENLKVETLADRLRMSTYLKGKAVAISVKPRAAIPLAGRLGQAWWFHDTIGKFVTGTFYLKEFPEWVTKFNDQKLPDSYFGKEWQPVLAATEYQGEDDRAIEADILGLGRTFPHPITGGLPGVGPQFHWALTRTPFMNDILVQLAKAAIDGEKLGKDDVPDMLAVSFSTIDKLNHLYGPYSWEVQDAMLRLDRTLGELISAAEKAAGSKANLLVVLSADHGSGALPEEWASAGLPAGRLNPETVARELSAALKAKFGGQSELLLGFDEDGVDVYLDNKAIAERKLDPVAVRKAAADFLRSQPQIAAAVSRDDLFGPNPLAGYLSTLQRGFHPDTSGDVMFLARPFTVVDRELSGTNHSTPYSYDAYVPVMFAGRGIRPGMYPQEIETIDVAPTIATLLEMAPPAQAEGKPRAEIISAAKSNGAGGGSAPTAMLVR